MKFSLFDPFSSTSHAPSYPSTRVTNRNVTFGTWFYFLQSKHSTHIALISLILTLSIWACIGRVHFVYALLCSPLLVVCSHFSVSVYLYLWRTPPHTQGGNESSVWILTPPGSHLRLPFIPALILQHFLLLPFDSFNLTSATSWIRISIQPGRALLHNSQSVRFSDDFHGLGLLSVLLHRSKQGHALYAGIVQSINSFHFVDRNKTEKKTKLCVNTAVTISSAYLDLRSFHYIVKND